MAKTKKKTGIRTLQLITKCVNYYLAFIIRHFDGFVNDLRFDDGSLDDLGWFQYDSFRNLNNFFLLNFRIVSDYQLTYVTAALRHYF